MKKTLIGLFTLLFYVTNCFTYSNAFLSDKSKSLKNSIVLYVGSPKVIVNEKVTQIDKDNYNLAPLVKDDKVYVPIRFIAESLKIKLNYDKKTLRINLSTIGKEVVFTIGQKEYLVNGVRHSLKTAPFVNNGSTFVPIETIASAFNKKVSFDSTGLVAVSETEEDFFKGNSNIVLELIDTLQLKGNSNGNSIHGGFVVQQGEWIYYRNYLDFSTLYRIKTNGTGKKKLCNDSVSDLNIIGDWIYYNTYGSGIYRIKKDGSQKKKITDDKCYIISSLCVTGQWIYYCNSSDNDKLYKISLDGLKKIKISDDRWARCINAVGDQVYYINGGSIYKINALNGDKELLSSDNTSQIEINNGWIYYDTGFDLLNKGQEKLYKMRLDGSEKTLISDKDVGQFNVFEDKIYYSLNEEDIYCMDTDGSNISLIIKTDYITAPNVVTGWIYCMADGIVRININNKLLEIAD